MSVRLGTIATLEPPQSGPGAGTAAEERIRPIPPGPAPGDAGGSGPGSTAPTGLARARRPRRRGRRALAATGLVVVTSLVGTTAGVSVTALLADPSTTGASAARSSTASSSTTSTSSSASTSGTTSASGSGTDLSAVVSAVLPSVVSITVTLPGGTGAGSGIVLTSTGLILTNNHVIEAAASGGGTLKVTFSDGRVAPATVVGRDAAADIAVIKAQGVSGVTPATLRSGSGVQVGDQVLAIGNPLGLGETVTSGVVSALNRTVQAGSDTGGSGRASTVTLRNVIQTDAATNPGNSGGALVDTSGHVIGIMFANASTSQNSGSIGIGFAIPIDTAKTVAQRLISAASAG